MPASINEIVTSFTTDFARASRFDVSIVPPTGLSSTLNNYSSIDPRTLQLRCEISQLPGKHLSIIEQKTYGPYQKFPYHTTYNDIDMTFIVDGDMRIKYFFDAWMNYINPTNNFNLEYRDNYCTNIIINQYDVANTAPSYAVTLVEAYPINVNQLDLDWSSEGVHKLHVTFAYTYWINDLESLNTPVSPNDSVSTLNGVTPQNPNAYPTGI